MTNKYESPLSSRYASEYMLHLFSADMRIQTWRKLWVSLAKAEMDYQYAGLYDLRLKVSQKGALEHINEYLYYDVELDNRTTGEKNFDCSPG